MSLPLNVTWIESFPFCRGGRYSSSRILPPRLVNGRLEWDRYDAIVESHSTGTARPVGYR